MMLWARLTWQAPDPGGLVADLERRLEISSRPGGLVPGASLLDLGTALLEVRPWIHEGPADREYAAGRLLLEPVPGGEEPPGPGTGGAMTLAAFGWATVEVDRAERELDLWLGPPAGGEGGDEHLGARARLRRGAGLPGEWSIMLEPQREGRAAASLARDGEGPCAIYLRPAVGLAPWSQRARERRLRIGSERQGPLGRQVLLPGRPDGPHVIVTEGRSPLSPGSDAGTIAP